MKVRLYHIVVDIFRAIDVIYEIQSVIWRFSDVHTRRYILTHSNCHFVSWRHLMLKLNKDRFLLHYARTWKHPPLMFRKMSMYEKTRNFIRAHFADRSRKYWTVTAKLRRAIATGDV